MVPPVLDDRFAPLANHAQFLAANLAPVHIESFCVKVTTPHRNSVTVSDTATARCSVPRARPRHVRTAPGTAVPLQETTVPVNAGPVLPSAPKPVDAPDTTNAPMSSAAAAVATTHAAPRGRLVPPRKLNLPKLFLPLAEVERS